VKVEDQSARPFRELGEHLAQLRIGLGLSQRELSERSALTRHPFDRTYVAWIELGAAGENTAKFLTYLSLLQADPETVIKLVDVAMEHSPRHEELDHALYLARARQSFESDRCDEGLGWVLAGLNRAEQSGAMEWAGRFCIGASIVLRALGNVQMAQRFAARAFNLMALGPDDRARAAIMLSRTLRLMGNVIEAQAIVQHALRELALNSAQLRAELLGESINSFEDLSLPQRQLVELQALAAFTSEAKLSLLEASVHADLALLLALSGRAKDSEQHARLALAISQQQAHKPAAAYVYYAVGRSALLCGRRAEGRQLLFQAEQRAKQVGERRVVLLARVALLELANRTKDSGLRRLLRLPVIRLRREVPVYPADRRYLEEVLAGTPNPARSASSR
jgi:transcriptional regulator with XRE-family HTH domain